MSAVGSLLVGILSMVPLFLISQSNYQFIDSSNNNSSSGDKNSTNFVSLKYVLSFAVGGLLGDVFFHLLPEASDQLMTTGMSARYLQLYLGFWILTGVLCFSFAQHLSIHLNSVQQQQHCNSLNNSDNNNINSNNNKINNNNNNSKHKPTTNVCQTNDISGYLNLLANSLDNLTHGLAIGASFLVNTKTGLLTTLAIAIHEIPHEIGDFAILVKCGFTKWQAIRAQLSISSITVIGAFIVLLADSVKTININIAWILPFTSGAFLYISLTTILPELLTETQTSRSLIQSLLIIAGIAIMASLNSMAID
ncbi:zinc transporter ZIP13-like [Oppia nitens]|uniref:zinc transporter ZIP13-like n=1 Tax=Oppia nitens TaxID=1686743 RepID=UPI0023D9EC62|nr:zinc transporter ZIP13-like [Oppia nitens]